MEFSMNKIREFGNELKGLSLKKHAAKWRQTPVYRLGIIFSPGIFLICIGLLAMVLPTLFLACIAAFFVFGGALFCLLAWKLLKFKRSLDGVIRNVEARVYIKPEAIAERMIQETLFYEGEDKKNIILH